MSFFDKMFAFLGFESQEEKDKINKSKKKIIAPVNSNYNLRGNSHNKRLPATRNVSSQDQVVQVLEELKRKSSIIIDLTGFEKMEKIRAFDFISGAVFALNGQIKKIESNRYLCTLDELTDFLEEVND